MTWTIDAELADVTVIQTGCTHAFYAIEVQCNGTWPNDKGPTLLLEDWAAKAYDDDDNRDLTPSDDATTLANQIVTAVDCHADLLAALEHLAQWSGAPDLAPVNPFDDGYNAGRMYAAEHAKAAIAKARGE